MKRETHKKHTSSRPAPARRLIDSDIGPHTLIDSDTRRLIDSDIDDIGPHRLIDSDITLQRLIDSDTRRLIDSDIDDIGPASSHLRLVSKIPLVARPDAHDMTRSLFLLRIRMYRKKSATRSPSPRHAGCAHFLMFI